MGIDFGDRASPIVIAAESLRQALPRSWCGASLHWQIRKAEAHSLIISSLQNLITPSHYTFLLHLLITPSHHTFSLHLLITPSHHTLVHLLITSSHYTLLHLLITPSHHTFLITPSHYTAISRRVEPRCTAAVVEWAMDPTTTPRAATPQPEAGPDVWIMDVPGRRNEPAAPEAAAAAPFLVAVEPQIAVAARPQNTHGR
eukprot:360000-Chlamydomonas_euryale.AAC.4